MNDEISHTEIHSNSIHLVQHFPFLLILSKLFNLSGTPLLNCSEFIAIMNTFKGHKFNK